jgi:ankyrin repeat protein
MTSQSLPERPDLDQLRRRAKELRDAARAGDAEARARLAAYDMAGPPVTLAAAQLAIAREHGCASWAQLKAAVEERLMDRAQRVRAFLVASVTGHGDRAARLLRADPTLAGHDLWTAAVLGEVEAVRRMVARDPALAVEADAESGWPPLLAVCNSRWHQLEPARGRDLCEVADVLMDAGASPDTAVGRPPAWGHCSALYAAAGLANHPALAELLLKRGADPDTPAALYHTAFHRDHVCLRLLLDHGARAEGPDALAAAISVDDVEAVRLLLDAGVDAGRPLPPQALGESYAPEPPVGPVHAAVELQASTELVAVLLEGGADPDARGQDGRSAYQVAVRHGNTAVTELLRAHGAIDDASTVDRFLGACLRADRAEVDRHRRDRPGLVAELRRADHRAIAQAAENGNLPAVRLMLDVGFPLNAKVGDDGATPLHAAASAGAVDLVAFLLERGADIEATDTTWGATPLRWATVGSGFRLGRAPHPDWAATVRLFIDAGASIDDAWVVGKPPSPEVAAVLHERGIHDPDEDDLP